MVHSRACLPVSRRSLCLPLWCRTNLNFLTDRGGSCGLQAINADPTNHKLYSNRSAAGVAAANVHVRSSRSRGARGSPGTAAGRPHVPMLCWRACRLCDHTGVPRGVEGCHEVHRACTGVGKGVCLGPSPCPSQCRCCVHSRLPFVCGLPGLFPAWCCAEELVPLWRGQAGIPAGP